MYQLTEEDMAWYDQQVAAQELAALQRQTKGPYTIGGGYYPKKNFEGPLRADEMATDPATVGQGQLGATLGGNPSRMRAFAGETGIHEVIDPITGRPKITNLGSVKPKTLSELPEYQGEMNYWKNLEKTATDDLFRIGNPKVWAAKRTEEVKHAREMAKADATRKHEIEKANIGKMTPMQKMASEALKEIHKVRASREYPIKPEEEAAENALIARYEKVLGGQSNKPLNKGITTDEFEQQLTKVTDIKQFDVVIKNINNKVKTGKMSQVEADKARKLVNKYQKTLIDNKNKKRKKEKKRVDTSKKKAATQVEQGTVLPDKTFLLGGPNAYTSELIKSYAPEQSISELSKILTQKRLSEARERRALKFPGATAGGYYGEG